MPVMPVMPVMPMIRRTRRFPMRVTRLTALAVLLTTPVARTVAQTTQNAQNIPAKLSDSAFWKLVTDFSEPSGYFRSDNFVSNETTYQWVIPTLLRTTKPGGVYLGVGPDKNFTYLVALKPKIAFIFDIRRQNMLTHLMYKAIIEQSADRAEFLSRLFARPRPAGVDTASTPEALFGAYQAVTRDTLLARKNLAAIRDRLVKQHHFTLTSTDSSTIDYVYNAFVDAGPDITYNFQQGRQAFGRGRMPSYAELQLLGDSAGMQRGYMANEANYRALRQLQMDNLVVPLVGDFAGAKAIRAVATYLKERDAKVTAFYLSNVEQYLFNSDDDWRKFYTNVGFLPLDSSSTFIRSVFNGLGMGSYSPPGTLRADQLLASMLEQHRMFVAGELQAYLDVIRTSR
jgi:hypothetical protein